MRAAPVFAERLADHDTAIGKYPEFSVASLVQDQHVTKKLYEAFDLALTVPTDQHKIPLSPE